MPNPYRTRSWVVAHRPITRGEPARKPKVKPLPRGHFHRWKFAYTNALGHLVWVDCYGKDADRAIAMFVHKHPHLTADSIERAEYLGVNVF